MTLIKDIDLQAENDALRADLQALRAQLAAGVGVPDFRGASDGDVLSIVAGVPAWDVGGGGSVARTIIFEFDAAVSVGVVSSADHVLPGLPWDFQITSWRLRSQDVSGSIKVDVRVRGDDAAMTSGDSICGSSDRPYLSAEVGREETDLTPWTATLVAQGNRLGFHVDFSDIVALRAATLVLYGAQA